MAIAFVQRAGAAGSGATSTASLTVPIAANTTAGNTLFACVKVGGGQTVTVTDSKGNAWTTDLSAGSTAANAVLCRARLTTALTAADTVTVTAASAVSMFTCTLAEFSGIASSAPLDVTATNVASSSSTLSSTVGPTPTTTQANEVAITVAATGFASGNTATWIPPSGWTEVSTGLAANNPEDAAYLVLTATQTVSATWNCNQAANQSSLIATYKAATGGTTFTQTITAAAGASGSKAFAVQGARAATAGASASIVHRTNRTLAAASAASGTLAKRVGKALSAAAGAVASFVGSLVTGNAAPSVDLPTTLALESHVTTLGLESRVTGLTTEQHMTTLTAEERLTTLGVDG